MSFLMKNQVEPVLLVLQTCSTFFFVLQIMLLETSRRYNPTIDSITFLKDFTYNKEDFAKAGTVRMM